jgi:hypothetical protein
VKASGTFTAQTTDQTKLEITGNATQQLVRARGLNAACRALARL